MNWIVSYHIACISSPAVIEETLNLYALVGRAAEYHKPIITTNVTCSFIVPLVDFSECSLQFIIDGVCLFYMILTIEFICSVWVYLSLRYEMIRWTRPFIASTVVAANRIISSIAICTSSFPFVLCNDWTIFPYCCHWVWNIVCGVNCLLYSKQLSWYAVSLNKLAVFSCWVVLVVSVIVGSSLCLDQMQWHCSSYFRQKRKN